LSYYVTQLHYIFTITIHKNVEHPTRDNR
jgi:hypothetical protein